MFEASKLVLRSFCLLSCLGLMSGCEIGRSWFQMSSDSPTPFMGIDLLPRRSTSLHVPEAGERYPTLASQESVQQVAHREKQPPRSRIKEIYLPHISTLLNKHEEEIVAFPEVIGIDGVPD